MTDYHEPLEELTPADRDITRALTSLKEEIEAANWYHQRAVTCSNAELKEVLVHNRNEEIEHACMVMEWLRRNVSEWNARVKTYLFTEKPITQIEEETQLDTPEEGLKTADTGSIGIGSLKSSIPERG